MKDVNKFLLTLSFVLCAGSLVNVLHAQRAVRANAVKASTVEKPLDAKVLKLDTRATRILKRWINAKHMELLDSGHFVPMKNPSNTSPTSGNLPGANPTSFASGTNCAKIECPDVFDDSVTCWECH